MMHAVLLWLLLLAAPPRPRVAIQAGGETAAATKAFLRSCPAVQVTVTRRAADYLVALDHERWGLSRWKHDHWDLARGNGDVVAGGSAATLARAVKAACAAIAADRRAAPAPAR